MAPDGGIDGPASLDGADASRNGAGSLSFDHLVVPKKGR